MATKWWTLISVSVGIFMLLLDITIVNVALPNIQHELHSSFSDLQWVIDAYALTLAALLLTAGSLGDMLGRRKVYALGIVIFTAGSLLCGLATDPLFLALARAGQGIGGAIMFAVSLALLANSFQGRDRGVAFGIWGAITGVAVAVGPVLGGALVSGLSWRWIFLVNVPIGALLAPLTVIFVEESRDPNPHRPDWLGFILFSAALAGIIFGLIRSSENGWGSFTVVGSLAGGSALLVAFVIAEMFSKQPMFDLKLLRKPAFVGGLIAAFGISGGLFALFTFLILYLQNILGMSAIQSGIRILVLSGAIFLSAGIAGRLTSRVGTRWLIGPGFILIAIAILLMRGLTTSSHWTHLLPGLIVGGIGAGFVNVPLVSTAMGVVEPERAGMASGINSTFRQIGIAAGIGALGSIFSAHIQSTVVMRLQATPLASQAHAIAHAISTGAGAASAGAAPPALRQTVLAAGHDAFVGGLNHIFLVCAITSFVAALLCFVLIRPRDFVFGQGA